MYVLRSQITCKPGAYYYSGHKKYCGGERTTPLVLSYSNCDSLTLNFVTDAYVTSGGFKIWYTISSSGKCPLFRTMRFGVKFQIHALTYCELETSALRSMDAN